MIRQFKSLKEVEEWFSHERPSIDELILLAYKFTVGSWSRSPITSTDVNMISNIKSDIQHGHDPFKKGRLEVLY